MAVELILRFADYRDRPKFLKLWKSFMHEEQQLGSLVHPSDYNLRQHCQLFESYTGGSLFGLCVLAEVGEEPVGILMVGEDYPGGLVLETDLGKSAQVWGVYVDPAYRKTGLAHRMQDFGLPETMKLGFDTVTSMVLDSEAARANALNWGTKPYATLIYGTLGDLYERQFSTE
jgi:GNAT superfamily N-acetyltransferase